MSLPGGAGAPGPTPILPHSGLDRPTVTIKTA
jgi:hypothetical protein